MNEIYLITRLGMINVWLIVFSAISGAIMAVFAIIYIIAKCENDEPVINGVKSTLKTSTIVFFICLPLTILTPTKDEALLIWGVGSTIDYIQNNETVQQLPDKCVNALDAWVESLSDDKEE